MRISAPASAPSALFSLSFSPSRTPAARPLRRRRARCFSSVPSLVLIFYPLFPRRFFSALAFFSPRPTRRLIPFPFTPSSRARRDTPTMRANVWAHANTDSGVRFGNLARISMRLELARDCRFRKKAESAAVRCRMGRGRRKRKYRPEKTKLRRSEKISV